MNRFIFITVILIFNLFSCNEPAHKTLYVDLQKISITSIHADTIHMHEIQNPYSIYAFKKWIILPNSEHTANLPLYFYDKDSLNFMFNWGVFGRGPNEVYDCNPYYFEPTDSSFLMNINYIYETEFLCRGDSLSVEKNKVIAPAATNNLLKINDSISFFENRLEKYEYSLYNMNTHKRVKEFSLYPSTKISYKEDEDRDNICQKSCVINRKRGLIAAFYQNIPLIRIYNIQGELINEIKLNDVTEKSAGLEEFYDDKTELYFQFPYVTQEHIYVLFVNKLFKESHEAGSVELQQWNWDFELEKRFQFDDSFNVFCVAECPQKIFYGLNKQNEIFYFLKAALE